MATAGSARPMPLATAASIGAGLIHLAAAVAEHDRASVAVALAAVGIAQLAWGAWETADRLGRRLLNDIPRNAGMGARKQMHRRQKKLRGFLLAWIGKGHDGSLLDER